MKSVVPPVAGSIPGSESRLMDCPMPVHPAASSADATIAAIIEEGFMAVMYEIFVIYDISPIFLNLEQEDKFPMFVSQCLIFNQNKVIQSCQSKTI